MAARRQQQQEESIYNWGQHADVSSAASSDASRTTRGPHIKTYKVAAPAAAPARRMHEDSSQVESILKPVRGIRDAQRRAGITPTNHARLNMQAVREQSRLNALQQQQAAEARLQPGQTHTGSGGGGGSGVRGLRKAVSVGGGGAAATAGGGSSIQYGRSQSFGGGGGGGAADGSLRDFVEENKEAAAAAAAKRPVKAEVRRDLAPGGYLQKREYGQVPSYLLERKMQMAQEAEALLEAKAAAAIPPGLRRMPEAERLETLALLQQNRAEVEAKLQGLPIIIETHSMRRHKEDLERRLAEIEEARRVFSRPHVLVQASTTTTTGGSRA